MRMKPKESSTTELRPGQVTSLPVAGGLLHAKLWPEPEAQAEFEPQGETACAQAWRRGSRPLELSLQFHPGRLPLLSLSGYSEFCLLPSC